MFWRPPCFREGHVHKMEANCYEIERLDPRFPPSILELPSPPNKLYVRGDIELLNKPALSIIGARSASPYGLAIAEIAATIAAQSDICVVSGGAKGCDQAAGRSALAAGGKHIVVLGCGADVVYPRTSKSLFDLTLAQGGAIVSLDPGEHRLENMPFRAEIESSLPSVPLCV